MKNQKHNVEHERLLNLADRQLNGDATVDDVKELELLLNSDSDAQTVYLRYTLLHGQLGLTTTAMHPLAEETLPELPVTPAKPRRPQVERFAGQRWVAAVLLAIAASIVIMISFRSNPEAGLTEAVLSSHYDQSRPPLGIVGTIDQRTTGPLTLVVAQGDMQFKSAGGVNLSVANDTVFGVNSRDGGVLYRGSVRSKMGRSNSTFSVATSHLRIEDLGAEFKVDVLDDQHVAVRSLDGNVDVQTRIRLPLYYWHFDTPDTSLTFGKHAKLTEGIVGGGAVHFDNTVDSYVEINDGTGETVGTGTMACSSGISIEAMFVSHWSGERHDYDEIFRKEDGVYRILLSFQNDGSANNFEIPNVNPGPCLSFGLYLEGHGYNELDMPLDGKQGRPTVIELTDGRPHHVVATYDSFTGKKAIYIDGRLCFEHTYPIGSLVLSGGAKKAMIGNITDFPGESFHGIIDEVALYDFALTADEITRHHRNASAGISYFGKNFQLNKGKRWQSVAQVSAGSRLVFDNVTGLPVDSSSH